MARVLLENVTKEFDGKVVAVRNMTLDITDQEFMVIVGPSGCGKTTTLRMIAGLEEITSGTITIGNAVVNNIPPKDRDIAMVFQNYALYPHMTVFQNMAFGLKLRKYPKAEIKKHVEDTARMLGIETLLDRKPKTLSGGQRQRVALGRAIVRNPKAFLFDEPLSNLDAKLRVTTRTELKALHRRLEATTIYVTHDQAEAMTLGDRICVMYEGVIQQIAEPMEIYDKPVNKFVAGFLGTLPMNFFDVRVEVKDGKPVLVCGDDVIVPPTLLKDVLSDYRCKQVVMGIRPEDLSPNPFDDESHNFLTGCVQVVEPLGDRMDVRLETRDEVRFAAKTDPHLKINIGEAVKMYVDTGKLHIFEPGDTGRNLNILR